MTQCLHIYLLPPPNGAESLGVCKLCGMTKTHLNSGNDKGSVWRAWEGKQKEKTWAVGEVKAINKGIEEGLKELERK